MQPIPQEQDLLSNFEPNLVRASSGKRFANYIIDLLLFYLLAAIIIFLAAMLNTSSFEDAEETSILNILDRILYLLLYGIYMFVVEALFKGKSLGKLITGTRAVNLDGSRISITTALGRGMSRAVPFNELSALGSPPHPWHDKWNKSLVIDEKLSATV
jgi:uncharacterized RDD family membrane protein YckC